MGGCFSCFKQHFASGKDFAYNLRDLGQYYCDYVAMVAHFDAVLPGRIYENARAVRTPSSEQVRSPIFRDAIDQWRHFESWLGPLKEALGSLAG